MFYPKIRHRRRTTLRVVRKGVLTLKRVRSACIFQTLVFGQKAEFGYSRERALAINREELKKYKEALDKGGTRYRITEETEDAEGSVIVKIRKEYNEKTDVSEYFGL